MSIIIISHVCFSKRMLYDLSVSTSKWKIIKYVKQLYFIYFRFNVSIKKVGISVSEQNSATDLDMREREQYIYQDKI